MKRILFACLLMFAHFGALAENILMVRSRDNFDATMETAKQSLESHGYVIAHIQRCDGGLKEFGFTTDPYCLIFFGKPHEVRELTDKYPELIPYLPLKLAVFAEDKEVLAAIFNPDALSLLFNNKDLEVQFKRWKSDFDSILADIHNHSTTN